MVVSTNEAERQLALTKYNELYESASVQSTARSKSKSPRRSRPHPSEALPPLPVNGASSSSAPYIKSKTRSRRPHTSAGPCDKPVNFAGGVYGRPRVQEGGKSSPTNISGEDVAPSSKHLGTGPSSSKRHSELVPPLESPRPESRESAAKQPRTDGWKPNFWPTTFASISSSSPEEDVGRTGSMQEWEQQLVKIELKSRKSSDFLGFFKRKRSEGPSRVAVP